MEVLMRRIVAVPFVLLTLMVATAYGAEAPKEIQGRFDQLSERASKLASTKVGEYAKDDIAAARTSISAAKLAQAAKNEKLALQKLEIAEVQLTIAEARTAEKEAAEQATLKRAQLKQQESRLDSFFQEGGK